MLWSNLHLSSEDTCKLGCGIKMERERNNNYQCQNFWTLFFHITKSLAYETILSKIWTFQKKQRTFFLCSNLCSCLESLDQHGPTAQLVFCLSFLVQDVNDNIWNTDQKFEAHQSPLLLTSIHLYLKTPRKP